jgi:hypothetical protein
MESLISDLLDIPIKYFRILNLVESKMILNESYPTLFIISVDIHIR